jgi:FkbM family methyltransferase
LELHSGHNIIRLTPKGYDMIRKTLRKMRRLLLRTTDLGRPSVKFETIRLGSENGGWTISPAALSPESIVYSAGVGEDISFDIELIKRFAVTVHAFDPTPRSIAWTGSQLLPSQFVMHAYGIANVDGMLSFGLPDNPSHVSLSTARGRPADQLLSLPVRRLSSIMRELGHPHIDLLKMDIEGSEYCVVEDLVASSLPVRQLLIEYHHRFPSIGNERTLKSLELLRTNGFKLFDVSESGEEFAFMGPALHPRHANVT